MKSRTTSQARLGPVITLALTAAFSGAAGAGEFDCIIEPRHVLELRSPIEGLIERVNVDRGDLVRKGQELAVLDTAVDRAQAAIARQRSQMEGALRSGESRVQFTSSKSQRMQELHAENYISAQMRDEAATEKQMAEAELQESHDNRRLAELDLLRQLEIIRLKTIRSPVDGVVVERLLHPGELAEAGVGRKPMLRIAQIDVLHVEVLLRADAYGNVQRGAAIEVTPDLPGAGSHVATVKVIDRVLDAASGTFGVRLELPNPQQRIPAGVRCRANFPGIDAAPAGRARPTSPNRP
jgi:RND family efflux transporter MFP subunit